MPGIAYAVGWFVEEYPNSKIQSIDILGMSRGYIFQQL